MMAKKLLKLSIYLLLLAYINGCATQEAVIVEKQPLPVATEPKKSNLPFLTKSAGKSVQGRNIDYIVYGNGNDVVMIMAGIHGNERGGVEIAKALEWHLKTHLYKAYSKTIIIMPIANPDGYANNSRYNANYIDLNRNFTTSNRINNHTNGFEGQTEPESRAIAEVIEKYRPNRILSIHAPLNCVDYDGPGQNLAYQISYKTGLPLKKLGSRPGSMGSYCGIEKNIPIITLELSAFEDKQSMSDLWYKYHTAILDFIRFSY
jgi:protein MpaA